MKRDIIVIGGSAGSFQTIVGLVATIPVNYPATFILCLHRLKHVRAGFVEALSIKTNLPIVEPEDKAPIELSKIYLAPANYHLLVDQGMRFALSTAGVVNHSRPAIDLTFRSAAINLRNRVIGVLLSGANKDGAKGLSAIQKEGGLTIVQSPEDAQVSAMPLAAMALMQPDMTMTKDEIIDFLTNNNRVGR